MKALVIYYSLEGTTRLFAQTIAQAIGADLCELKLKKDINPNGFMKYFWGGKQVFQKQTPELEPLCKEPQDYDLIILGTPVWAFNFTPAIRSFFKLLKSPDTTPKIKGKKVAVFCCHEGNKNQTLENMVSELSGNQVLGEIDFLNSSKIDTENNLQKARDWALKISKN